MAMALRYPLHSVHESLPTTVIAVRVGKWLSVLQKKLLLKHEQVRPRFKIGPTKIDARPDLATIRAGQMMESL